MLVYARVSRPIPMRYYSSLFVFVLCPVFHMLTVSLNCPFLIAPSVFSNVYLELPIIISVGWYACVSYPMRYCISLFIFVLCLVYPMLPVVLKCSFLIATSVFANVYLELPVIRVC